MLHIKFQAHAPIDSEEDIYLVSMYQIKSNGLFLL